MNVINGGYATSQYYNNTIQQKQKNSTETVKSYTAKESERALYQAGLPKT